MSTAYKYCIHFFKFIQAQFLQKIVQKECEERFELTEALSEARKELLHLKKPPGRVHIHYPV